MKLEVRSRSTEVFRLRISLIKNQVLEINSKKTLYFPLKAAKGKITTRFNIELLKKLYQFTFYLLQIRLDNRKRSRHSLTDDELLQFWEYLCL